ncbi:hypothetical protein H2200_005717 [Cladophialophora chaetospira]|uniref:Uncharacterized protein n=1 Tax=Cladophialophora chaetospira TaxID=386627 RepID=A0AA39CIK3_9EURO|nr:hypothetical protein H2200_005717 [Cladophialophora chaetospira]
MTGSSPTSPAMPTPSPRSPCSPMALDRPAILPRLVTDFTPEQMLRRQSAFSAMATTPRSSKTFYPWSRSNGTSIRRNSLTSPINSPAQSVFTPMVAEFSSHTVRTPERAFFHSGNTPTMTSFPTDGRQSRMAMRSPGYGTTMTLPLRVNTNLSNVQEEEYPAHANMSSSSTTSLIEWAPANATAIRSTSASPSRRLVRSHTPAPITTRSPIRKRAKLSRFPTTMSLPPPPKYHVTVVPTVSPCTERARQAYTHSVEHLRSGLVPLISVSTGLPHPQFPTSLLQYHLLTHEQLDSLARWYHQVEPAVEETFQYPTCIPAWTGLYPSRTRDEALSVDLETKRRRWGRFIGLRGCESPTVETDENGNAIEGVDLVARMQRDWRRALERADEEARAFEKSWRGRW